MRPVDRKRIQIGRIVETLKRDRKPHTVNAIKDTFRSPSSKFWTPKAMSIKLHVPNY